MGGLSSLSLLDHIDLFDADHIDSVCKKINQRIGLITKLTFDTEETSIRLAIMTISLIHFPLARAKAPSIVS